MHIMAQVQNLASQYDRVAGGWGDKMRTLGYSDAYLGFLASGPRARAVDHVCDVGCGTGAFAEAWMGIYGAAANVTLMDPSELMLDRAAAALMRRGGDVATVQAGIEGFRPTGPFDHLLMAHVIEHVPDPTAALRQLRGWVTPGARLWLVVSKPHWCNAIIWLQWRHRAFQEVEVTAVLQDTGWRLEDTYAFPSGPPSRTSRGYLATAI